MSLTYPLFLGVLETEKEGDAALKIIGERLRSLRESVRLSQAKLAKELDVSQSALARYEIDDSTPSPEVFLKYADYFDVSLDYIFGRTDDPHGMIYNNCVKLGLNNPEMARFVEMCFDPGSASPPVPLDGRCVLLPPVRRSRARLPPALLPCPTPV